MHYQTFRRRGDPHAAVFRKRAIVHSYVDGDCGYIELAGEGWALVDAEDFERVNTYKWHKLRTKTKVYAATTINNRQMLMHRFILNTPKGRVTDHEDRNGLDNRKSNIRDTTQTQNLRNVGITSRNKSGYKGVCWDAKAGKWKAQVSIGGRTKFLGNFDNPKDAARAYNRKARELGFLYVPPEPD